MRLAYVAVVVACLPVVAVAEPPSLSMSPTADYLVPDVVAENIRSECKLPEYQAEAVRRQVEGLGVKLEVAAKDEVPPSGKFLQLRITNAVSSGNAFVGHRKHVAILVKLFDNGKELAKTSLQRDSSGGFSGGFKGSCAVLERCAKTLGKDTAEWLKKQLSL
jgi:hypothetical protein